MNVKEGKLTVRCFLKMVAHQATAQLTGGRGVGDRMERTNKKTLERQVLANTLLDDIAKIAVIDVKENGDGAGDSDGDSNGDCDGDCNSDFNGNCNGNCEDNGSGNGNVNGNGYGKVKVTVMIIIISFGWEECL